MIKEMIENENGLSFRVDNFNLEQTFECGQCFRWDAVGKDHYIGVVKNKVLEIRQDGEVIQFINAKKDDLLKIWIDYFDLRRDYGSLIGKVSCEEVMLEATNFGTGIHLLCQDEWETLLSFIISANNNIPRIKKIIQSFCELFGEQIDYDGKVYYSFPTPERLQGITIKDLSEIKSGYRSNYIVDAVMQITSGTVDLYHLKNLETEQARKELLKIKGVGPKVADCILLFAMGKYDCYPMDVWIKKVTESYYFQREATPKEIQELAKTRWGDLAGFAQQYLFYYARNHLK